MRKSALIREVASEFDADFRGVLPLIRRFAFDQVLIQQAEREGGLRFGILPDGKVYHAFADHLKIVRSQVVHHNMHLSLLACAADCLINAAASDRGEINAGKMIDIPQGADGNALC